MKTSIIITRVSPLATIQDLGRFGFLVNGISASGAMDRAAFEFGASLLSTGATSGIEFTQAGLDFLVKGARIKAAFTGGEFTLIINKKKQEWNKSYSLKKNDRVEIKPSSWGNYGYLRFNAELDVKQILNSRATNINVGIGGFDGRCLKKGDEISLLQASAKKGFCLDSKDYKSPIFNFIWGIHAEEFTQQTRDKFTSSPFIISSQLDRMGVRLKDNKKIFANIKILNLVSEPLVCGDIQILGDGTPIVLMRDHQTVGGYPRIGTIISKDIDRFAQMRPKSEIFFKSISVENIGK